MERSNLKPFQRLLALFLCLAMIIPYAVPVGATETTETDESQGTGVSGLSEDVEYVSLPITIRDFAADGMLFEFNQVNLSSKNYAPWKTFQYVVDSLNADYNWDNADDNNRGFRIRTYAKHGANLPSGRDLQWWYGVVCDSNGNIKAILPSGIAKTEIYDDYMTTGCYAIWIWTGDGTESSYDAYAAYTEFAALINDDTKHRYHITYTEDGTMTIGVEYLEYNGKKYILGDNNGFTLLLTDESDYVNNLSGDDSIPGSHVVQNNTNGTTPPDPVQVTLNSGAPQYVNAGNMRLDLLTAELDKDKKPVYTEATVTYLANLLSTMLQVPYTVELGGVTYYTGYYILGTNLFDKDFNYVGQDSADAVYGLADVLRQNINSGLGSYADSQAKFNSGTLKDPVDADTYFDAAYYLLHSVWRDGTQDATAPGSDGYGWNTWNYDKINLIQTTNENGEKCYVFNSGYDDTKYDPMDVVDGVYTGSGAIYNTQVQTMTGARNPDGNGGYTGSVVYSNGILLPNARFDPLGRSGSGQEFGYGMDAGTYCELLDSYPDRGEIFYPKTNYHHTLEGHAKFIYYEDANQYFTFTGDDDVYLYINGTRVLDLGGAHAIAEVSINLNDIAELCGLSDGSTYDFDFYYMERHGTAANFGIETNIQIVDPSMLTTKQGYQNGVKTDYNGYVNPDIPVVYEFGLENNGEAPIQNLTFEDKTIGVSLTKDTISLNALTTMDDLSIELYGSNGEIKSTVAAGSLTEDVLKQYLTTGLEIGEKIVIHGFSYKILNGDWACRYVDANGNGQYDEGEERTSNWYFFNIIYTTATAAGENNSTKELTGTSNWVVQQLSDEALGSLTITKQLDEDASHTLLGEIYTMQVLLDGKPIPAGTAYTYILEDGTKTYPQVETAGQIPLAVGATAKLRAAYGTTFQVSELIAEADREVYHATYTAVNAEVTDTGVTGTFPENAEAAVTVTNHTLPGNLVETDKWVEAGETANQFTLTLESFVKGELTNVATTTPADFVLVLDQSASMYAPAGGASGYDNKDLIDPDTLSSYLGEGVTPDSAKAQYMGYYIAQSNSGRLVKQDDGTTITYYDWFVVQYIDGKWYYVRTANTSEPVELDVNYTGSTNVIGETLVRDNPIDTFNYYQSGYGALYDSVTGFVKELNETGVDHRVAVVGFASPFYDAMEHFDGSGVYVNGEYYLYDTEYLEDENGIYSYIYKDGLESKYPLTDAQIAALPTVGAETVYDKALVSVKDNYNSVLNSLNAVTTNYWHTCPAAGLDMANHIFEATPSNGRNRTVVLFTDGVPTVRLEADYEKGKNWTTAEDGLYVAHKFWTVAQGKDSALEVAYETKNTYGVNIHTVGTAGAGADTLFLQAMSSDYPDAQAYPVTYTDETGTVKSFEDDGARQPTAEEKKALMGNPIADPMFSHLVSSDLSLDAIFEEILQTTTNLELGADAVLKEVLTDYFELENGTVEDIKVYTALYDGNGKYGEKTELTSATVTLSSSDGSERLDTIEVTGYDYAAEFVSDIARQKLDADGNVLIAEFYGSKLIVEVQIKTREGFWGGNNVPTNEDTTAIYEKTGDLVDKFPEPQVNVPLSLTLASDDAVVYYGSDVLDNGLLTELTAGGLPVVVNDDGTLAPQAEWMDDFATLTWTGNTAPDGALSTTEPGEYTYSATLVPNTDGTENTCTYPSNMAGEKIPTSGITVADTSTVDVLVPVIPFKDSTITKGEEPDENYFNSVNLVDESIHWVLIDETDKTAAATHGTAPDLQFTYTPTLVNGVYAEATPVEVTVSAQYGDAAAMDFTGVSYFDWLVCQSGLHDEGTIALHAGGTASQNEFWIHVGDVPDSGVVTDKYVTATEDANAFELTLEAYALGEQETITVTKPADIVLVLDHSGSMRTPAGASKVLYSQVYDGDALKQVGEPYDGTASPLTKDMLETEEGQHTGYYVAWSTSSMTWFVLRYDAEEALWYGYSVPSTESIVNIQYENAEQAEEVGGWTEHTMTQSWTYENLPSQFLYYKSQYAMLYDAVNTFTTQLRASGAEHRVAIVGFAGPDSNGAGVYVNGYVDDTYEGFKYYKNLANNSDTERLNKLYREAFKNVQNTTDYSELLSAIEAIETNHSFTCPAAGLDLATDLYAANETDPAIRDRIVVLFTDGIPNRMTSNATDSTDEQIFNEIVEYAYTAKQQGATIYSISTTTLEEGENGENRTFLSYVSSDYPNAVSYTNPGSAIADQKYTQRVENIEAFSTMFDSITSNISSTTTTLDEKAILREVLTDYFVLNPNTVIDVEIYTATYNGDGTFAEPVPRTEDDGFKAILSSSDNSERMDTIDVVGFDYHDEYISTIARKDANGNDYYGSKLIVKVKIRTRDGFWGGNNVPTNDKATAIYTPESTGPNGETIPSQPVEYFPEPEVNVPIEVTVEAVDKTIYYNGSLDSDGDNREYDELLDKVTIGGMDVTVNNDGSFDPAEDWMDDFATASWADGSTDPDSDLSNTNPGDYTYTVTVTPNSDGTSNTQDNPGNITGNIDGGDIRNEDLAVPEDGISASDTGHVFILIPELTFQDSTTAFGTPTDGYDYKTNDYVESETKWVFMEDEKDTADAPAVSGTAPELTLTYIPNAEDVQDGSFVTDTKVDVTVFIGDLNITDLTTFHWKDCEHDVEDIESHKGNAASNEFWVHVALNIVPDTVVIDFGLDVVIDVLSNDPQTENIKPVLSGIGAEDAETFGDTAVPGAFGQLSIDSTDTSKVRYALSRENGMQINKEEVFKYQATYTIKGEETALSETVTVIPATVIYYEDEFVNFTVWNNDAEMEQNMDEDKQWEPVDSAQNADQAQDRPGDDLDAVDADNIYGYDGAYTNMAEYSMDSAMKVTVDDSLFAEAQFTFYGTGFDIISLTSGTTGTILVDVYKTSDFKTAAGDNYTAEIVESHMVDTYYGYQYTLCNVSYLYTVNDNGELIWERSVDSVAESGAEAQPPVYPEKPVRGDIVSAIEYDWIVDANASDALYQVPVMKVSGLEYDQYTALITVSYKSALDHKGTGSYDFYLDAIRIYDPANDGAASETVKNAYVADGEGWPEYFELRNLIISKNDFNSLTDGTGEGIVFIDNTLDADKNVVYSIEDYTNYGPNNELYLAPGQAVAFELNVPDPSDACQVAGIHLAMKSTGGTANVKVYDADDATYTSVTPTTIATATDLYYDITDLNGKTVVITNTDKSGDAILSITNVKVTYTSAHTDGIEKGYFTTTQTVAETAVYSLRRMAAADATESVVVNESTGTGYATLTEALNEAQQGDTIKLLQDTQESNLMVTTGVTLDLNGKNLTADYVVGFSGADIIDSAGGGKLIISAENVVLDEANNMIPVYDGDGYIFTMAGFAIRQDNTYTGEGIMINALAYPVNTEVIELLKNGASDNNLQVLIKLTWDSDQGTGSQEFVFYDDVVAAVYSSNQDDWTSYGKMFAMRIIGLENIQNMNAYIMLVSDTNVRVGAMMNP